MKTILTFIIIHFYLSSLSAQAPISGNSGCVDASIVSQGLSGNQFYGQTFQAQCSGFLEYVQINLYPNQSGIVTANTLKINEGNVIGFGYYSQDFDDVVINNGDHLRIYLNNDYPIIEGNQYVFETYVANLNVSVDLTDTHPNGHMLVGHASLFNSDLGFEVGIKENSGLNVTTKNNSNILIFPNPTTDYIGFKNLHTGKNYVIYNVLGKEVASGQLTSDPRIPVYHFEKGMYFLKFENHETLKFIKN